jgi:hypothetical protein
MAKTSRQERTRRPIEFELYDGGAPSRARFCGAALRVPPELIAERLHLSVERVNVILDELEKHMTFVFRNGQGAVAWAYPVTVDRTPHRITFSTGEQVYAA